MLLPGSRHQKLLGLRIPIKTQGKILFEQFMERVAHAVFIAAALGFDSERDRGLRHLHRRERHLGRLVRQRIAGERLFQLGHGADIASV